MSSRSSRLLSFEFLRGLSRFPGTLLAICLLLIGTSLIVLRSASVTPDGQMLSYMNRQAVWACVGLLVFSVLAFVPYHRLGRRCIVFYALGILCLLAVFVVGTRVNGARRWFTLGTIRVQPSEFMKYALVIVLAHVISRRGQEIKTWGGLAEAGLITSVPFLLVLAQPDLGTALTYLPILFAMVFVAGASWKHLLATIGTGAALTPLVWSFVLRPYQKLRLTAFLNPEDHVRGGAYQTLQSLIAVGSGGVTGRGYMEGTQGPLGFLPERHTDFIFAVVCEDFGFVGGALLLALYAYLICALAQIASQTRDMEGRLLVTGVAAIILVQVAVNVGMALGVAPVTGLTLPLVSYGGSSMVAAMFGFGLAASVARSRATFFGR